jgi:hypothetical protein
LVAGIGGSLFACGNLFLLGKHVEASGRLDAGLRGEGKPDAR